MLSAYLRTALAKEDDFKLIKSPNVYHDDSYANHYRRYLTKNIFMFLTLPNSGLNYSTHTGVLVKPHDFIIGDDSFNKYNITDNAFYLYN